MSKPAPKENASVTGTGDWAIVNADYEVDERFYTAEDAAAYLISDDYPWTDSTVEFIPKKSRFFRWF